MANPLGAITTTANILNSAQKGGKALGNVAGGYSAIAGGGISTADVSKITRVEPITMVSDSLKTLKELPDILHGILNINASHYCSAISVMATRTVDPTILKVLDSLNPDRDIKTFLTTIANEEFGVTNAVVTEREVSQEEYANNVRKYLCLEGLELGLDNKYTGKVSPSVEAFSTAKKGYGAVKQGYNETIKTIDDATNAFNKGDVEYELDDKGNVILDKNDKPVIKGYKPPKGKADYRGFKKIDAFDKMDKVVGKIIEVSFHKDGQDFKLPIIFKLDVMMMPSEVLINILTLHEESITFTNRFKDMMAGKISFFKDFLMCSDIITKQKKTMMNDPTKAYMTLLKRVNNSRIYSMLSSNISMAGISGIVVMTEEEEKAIVAEIGGGMKNDIVREIVFSNTSAMIVAVVDRDWETVTVYLRDAKGKSEIPFRNFKDQNSNNSDALVEIFKTMQMGRVPQF